MIDQRTLQKFVKKVGERLSGKWIIMGGSLLSLMQISERYTEDIDIVGPLQSSQKEMLVLMEIAQELRLPIEAINQAAGFFLYRIQYWNKELVLLHRGPKGEVYRPTVTLFLLLKIQRLSETDLEDCLAMITFAEKQKEAIHHKRIIKTLSEKLKKTTDPFKIGRIQKLKKCLSKSKSLVE